MPSAGTETILVVDDEEVVRAIAQKMLARYGYSTIVAASGHEALGLFEQWPDLQVDMMLIDLVMPDMDGRELAREIHRMRPALPVLFFTGYPDRVDNNEPCVLKPFTSAHLTASIRKALDTVSASSAGSAL